MALFIFLPFDLGCLFMGTHSLGCIMIGSLSLAPFPSSLDSPQPNPNVNIEH